VVSTGSWLINNHVDLLVQIDQEENLTAANIRIPPKIEGVPVDVMPVFEDSPLQTKRR
jgi:hypothetical protein